MMLYGLIAFLVAFVASGGRARWASPQHIAQIEDHVTNALSVGILVVGCAAITMFSISWAYRHWTQR